MGPTLDLSSSNSDHQVSDYQSTKASDRFLPCHPVSMILYCTPYAYLLISDQRVLWAVP